MAIRDHCFVDGDGLHLPDYPTVLAELQAAYRTIYGADVYLEADSQDGQWVAVLALSMFELMQVCSAVYNSFSPLTAQGDALSRQVKINGLRRRVPTASQVDLLVVGQAGTTIVSGLVEDSNGNRWALPAEVVIPVEGEITVTATAVEDGATQAAIGAVTRIITPTRGWQSVTNETEASPGDPVETDAELRVRQAVSTMIPSLSVMEGIVGAVAAVDGVTRWRGYENDTDVTDADGIPSHSIAIVAEGGSSADIAAAIHAKKTAGTGTHGDTTVAVEDEFGVATDIKFERPSSVSITVEVGVTPLTGFLAETTTEIAAAVAASINALGIGTEVYLNRLFTPANLGSVPAGATFVVDSIQISKAPAAVGSANLTLAWNEVAVCDPDLDVTVTVA